MAATGSPGFWIVSRETKRLKAKADRLFSQHIRSLGRCEAQGHQVDCSTKLECAHWISRRYSWTRTCEDNAFCLCSAHHRWFTANPTEFAFWAISRRGEQVYARLRRRSLRRDKFDWQIEVDRLEQIQ